MKNGKRLAALTLAAILTLSACGGGGSAAKDPTETGSTGGEVVNAKPVTDWVDWQLQSSEPSTFLLLWSEAQAISRIMCNVYSTLLEHNNHSELVPCVAKEVTSNADATEWTFYLRDDVVWTDSTGTERAKCTAQDWVTALEWILNYWKNEGQNTSMLTLTVAGAADYYEYTKTLSQEEAYALKSDGKFAEMVGVKAVDDYTLVYTCPSPIPYFKTLTTSACLYPISQAQIDEIGVANMLSADPTKLWSNGPYFITEYVQNNSVELKQNPNYWDKDATLFNSITFKFVEDANKDDQLFESDEVDVCTLSASNLRLINDDPNHQFHDNLVNPRGAIANTTMFFNWNKNLEDGETPDDNWNKAVRNEAFRQSLYWGLDLTEFWAVSNFINPESLATQNFTTDGIAVFSDGKDYTERVREITGVSGVRYDAAKGESYKKQAIEELTAQGVTFPIEVDYYIAGGNQTALDTANIWKTVFDAMGTDYVNFQIKTYVSNSRQEVMIPAKGSFYTAGWIADYGDPENFLSCVWAHGTGAFAGSMMHVNDEGVVLADEYETFTTMAKTAAEIVDLDKRYEAFAQAEAYAFQHALFLPLQANTPYKLTKMNMFTGPYATYGNLIDQMKNRETSVEPYTAEQYAQFAKDFAEGKI